MLVLSRRRDESIMIGDDVEITVVDIRGDAVRIGITAPRSVAVYRKEIYEAIQRENLAAAQTDVARLEDLGKLFPGAGKGKTPPSTRPAKPGKDVPPSDKESRPARPSDKDKNG
jgi:carbon storage regulator